MTPARVATVLIVVCIALAGCPQPPPPDGGNGDGDGTGPPLDFSGEQALAYAEAQMRWPNGSTRYRIPDTPGNDAVARMLRENWTALGWSSRLQRFNGSTFLEADKHPLIASYVGGSSCSESERDRLRNMSLHNVEATLGNGSREVLVTGHYDTKIHADQDPDDPEAPVPGADDGASAIAVLWELARVLPGRLGNVTVTLVAFDAEDGWDACYPSAGSTVYAESMAAARRRNVTAVVNLDMVGNLSASFPREGYSRREAPELVDAVWSIAARRDATAFADRDGGQIGDDHIPFQHAGMPAIDVIHSPEGAAFPPYWHTTRDTLDKLDASMLEQVGRVVEAFLLDADRGGWGAAS